MLSFKSVYDEMKDYKSTLVVINDDAAKKKSLIILLSQLDVIAGFILNIPLPTRLINSHLPYSIKFILSCQQHCFFTNIPML